MALLEQFDRNAVGRFHEGHVAVAGRPVNGVAKRLQVRALRVDVIDAERQVAEVARVAIVLAAAVLGGPVVRQLDLGIPEAVETYSSSPHLYTDLDIPEGTKGRLPRAQRTREGLDAERIEDLGETGKSGGRRSGGGRGGNGGGRGAGGGRGGERAGGQGEAKGDGDRPRRRNRNRRRTRGGQSQTQGGGES